MARKSYKSPKPDWFDIDKYSAANTMSASERSDQIMKRVYIKKFVLANDDKGIIKSDENLRRIEELKSNPLGAYEFEYNNNSTGKLSTKTVRSLRFSDMKRLKALENDFPSGATDFIDEWALETPDISSLLSQGNLVIDLNARDKDIIRDFKSWLAGFRKEVNRPLLPKKGKEDLKFFSRVFAYFDLKACKAYDDDDDDLTEADFIELLYTDDGEAEESRLDSLRNYIESKFNLSYATALKLNSHN